MCCSDKDLHALEPNMGLLVFILNIVPGTIGSLLYAFLCPRMGRALIVWLLQAATTWLFGAGWIWAIIYGYRIWRLSLNTALKNEGGFARPDPTTPLMAAPQQTEQQEEAKEETYQPPVAYAQESFREPLPEPVPDPVAEPIPEPITEPVPELITEPVS